MENREQCVRTRGEFEIRTHFLRIIAIAICGILFLGIKEVKAVTYPTMSTEQAEYIINYFKEHITENYVSSYQLNQITDEEAIEILNKVEITSLKSIFNEKIAQVQYDTTWYNISVFLLKGMESNSAKGMCIEFTISNNTVGNDYDYMKFNRSFYASDNYNRINVQNNGTCYKIRINITENGNLEQGGLNDLKTYNITVYPKITPEYNENNTIITNINYMLNINIPTSIYYNNDPYYVGTEFVTFNDDGTIGGQDIPSGDTSGDTSGDKSGDTSGDYTGQLNTINNSINTQGQAIINNQNENTNKIINTISGEVQKIIKEPESGEVESYLPTSGDILRKMNISPAIDPYASFWQNFIVAIREYMLNDTNVSIEWQIRDYIVTLNSQDFFVEENPLKTYTNTVLTALIVYNILKLIRKITEQINEGNFINVMHLGDADLYFF